MTRAALAGLLLATTGCAHLDGELTPPDGNVVSQLGAVRSGAVAHANADGYRFVREGHGIVAVRRWVRVADEEAYSIADESIAGGVAQQLRIDPALAQRDLQYRVHDHTVYLRGTADDAIAARAIFDVLQLPGVNYVVAELDRPAVAR